MGEFRYFAAAPAPTWLKSSCAIGPHLMKKNGRRGRDQSGEQRIVNSE
jgi:hypothetical protein